jgi:NADH-quinone oxidoreductase subunit L
VGLCSYLLIGFWYRDTEKAWAGRKAFITNRIGDFGFLIGMFLLVLLVGATEQMGRETALGRSNFTDITRARAWVTSVHDQGPLNSRGAPEWAPPHARPRPRRAGPG